MSDFDERSGIVPCDTPWGRWWQTIEEVFAEVKLEEGTPAKSIKCAFKTKYLKVIVKDQVVIEVCGLNSSELSIFFFSKLRVYLLR